MHEFCRFDIVNVNLTNKPEWLFEKNAEGKVPVLETNDGKILSESLIVADYIDEAYPSQRKLHPTDPYQKAQNRILLEKYGSSVRFILQKVLKINFGICFNEFVNMHRSFRVSTKSCLPSVTKRTMLPKRKRLSLL